MIIYKITNIVNNKVYIGLTTKTLEKRWKGHLNSINSKTKSSRYLYSSMKKHGINNFKIEEIEKCENINALFSKEIYWIKKYNSNNKNFGYNLSSGGEINIPNKETLELMSIKGKERWNNPEFKKKMIRALTGVKKSGEPHNKGKHLSDETKDKISKSRLGKMSGKDNHNFGKPGINLGKEFSEDHKNKISNSLIGNTNGKIGKEHHRSIQVVCIETGEIFESINIAKKKYMGKIYKAIKTGKSTCGYHWKKV